MISSPLFLLYPSFFGSLRIRSMPLCLCFPFEFILLITMYSLCFALSHFSRRSRRSWISDDAFLFPFPFPLSSLPISLTFINFLIFACCTFRELRNMATRLKLDEKNEKAVRNLLKKTPNRRCINCNSLVCCYISSLITVVTSLRK